MSTARQAAERITTGGQLGELLFKHPSRTQVKMIDETIAARDADTCQIISDQIRERIVNGRECERLYKKLTRERDEAREAARALWKEYIRRGPESSNFSQRFPWLKETT